MRTRISERNLFPNFSLRREYEKLFVLFSDNSAIRANCLYHSKTYYSYFEMLKERFLTWKLRGSFISVEEMMDSLGISKDYFIDDISDNRLLDFIQFILNAIFFVEKMILENPFEIYHNNELIKKAIEENCDLLLGKFHAEIKTEPSELYIVYKNSIASVAAVRHPHPKVEESIIDYLKIDNRDNLKRKSEILCSLAKDLEAHKESLSTSGQLYSDTTFLLNKSGIRHDLNPNDKQKAHFLAMNEQERIKWYDRTFEMILACMAELPYLKYKDEIQEIRRIK